MKVRQQMLQPNAPTLIRCDVETTSLTVCGQRLVTLSDDASGKGTSLPDFLAIRRNLVTKIIAQIQ